MHTVQKVLTALHPKTLPRMLEWIGCAGTVKYAEIALLGRFASTRCARLPDTVFLEAANACQLSCRYCYRGNEELLYHKSGMMSFEDYVRIADQLKGIRRLKFQWGGEPLLNPDIVRMLSYARTRRIARWIGLVTNGMLLVPDLADRILATGIDSIGVSLDSPDPRVQEYLRRGSSFDTITANLAYVADHAPPRTEVVVRAVLSNANLESILDMPEFLSTIGVKRLRTQTLIVRTSETRDQRPDDTSETVRILAERCRDRNIIYHHWAMKPKRRCIGPFTEIGVTWDGNITPCVYNLTEGLNTTPFDFRHFWNGPAIRDWRRRILTREYPSICRRNCTIEGIERTLDI